MNRLLFSLLPLLFSLSFPAFGEVAFDTDGTAFQMTSGTPRVYLQGTEAGLFRSTDERATWTAVQVDSLNRRQPHISQLVFHPGSQSVVYAAGPEPGRSVWRSDDAGLAWEPKMSGLPADGELQELFVILSQAGTLYAHIVAGGKSVVYKSTDRADTWARLVELPLVDPKFEIHLRNPQLWYYGSIHSIYRSQNEGQTWAITGPFPILMGSSNIQNGVTRVRTDPNNPDTLLIVTTGPVFGGDAYNNGIFYSPNRGATWERKNDTGGQNILVEPNSPAIFVTKAEGGGIWASYDRGRSFEVHSSWIDAAGAPATILVDPLNASIYHAPNGRSVDRGVTWTRVESTARPLLGLISEEVRLSGSRRSTLALVHTVAVEALGSPSWKIPFTIETPAESWLTVTPGEGHTRRVLTLKATPTGLAVGEYQTTIRATSTESANETVELRVALTVDDSPPPALSPTIVTFAGDGGFGGLEDGIPALEASLGGMRGLDVASSTGLAISDWLDDVVRRVDPAGVIHIVAGNGDGGFTGDGGPGRLAKINSPGHVAIGPDGSIYFTDVFNRRVRRVAPDGKISSFAGTDQFDVRQPTTGLAKDLYIFPRGLAIDAQGNLLVSDNSRIYRIDPQGVFTTWGHQGADALAVGRDGTVYAVRTDANRVETVRSNRIELIAGTGEPGYSGDGGPATLAQLNDPSDVAVDAEGRIYIADEGNNVVRMVDLDGTIRTYAGNGSDGESGDGGPANAAQLSRPTALAVGDDGALYIAHSFSLVRKVLAPGSTQPALTASGIVNAASYAGGAVAPDQIVSLFGLNLAPEVAVAQSTPLPTSLAGVAVELIDNAGRVHALPLIFVAPSQINCVLAAEAALGAGRLRITSGLAVTEAPLTVEPVAPGLFTANATGEGVAAAAAVRIDAGGAQAAVEVVDFSSRPFRGRPIDLGGESDQVVLLLFGTGFRSHQGPVEVTIGGLPAQFLGIAAQGQYVGLDQMNVIIPRSLRGAGEVQVVVTMGGKPLNVVTVMIQ